jgi:hypothetical protein
MKTTKIVMIRLFQCVQVTLIELHDIVTMKKTKLTKDQ